MCSLPGTEQNTLNTLTHLILFTTRGGTEAKEKSANECVIKDRKPPPALQGL